MRNRRQKAAVLLIGMAVLAVLLVLARRHAKRQITPDREEVFTSTRYISCLAQTPDGNLWVGTLGGILQRGPKGTWQKFTRREGLPAHEARRLEVQGETVLATFPTGTARWLQGRWQPGAAEGKTADTPLIPEQTATAVWRGVPCAATPTGLFLRQDNRWRKFPLPPASTGTHISALLPQGDRLWAAMYSDGLWAFDGAAWQPVPISLPSDAREITALAGDSNTLWVGTRRAGLWEYRQGTWKSHLQRGEPVDHNCQAITMANGSLYVSTLEDGMAVRTPQGWGHLREGALSSNAPRQMVLFQNALYLRHGGGKVDRRIGTQWERNLCAGLPRKQSSALAADEKHLFVAQWGGWSEFDGKTWTHHLNLPELQGLAITALCPDGDTLWVGTQGRGLAEVSRATGSVRWHDERKGLPDDWIIVLARVEGRLYAGTFIGGLACWDGAQWTTTPALKTENVTALEPDSAGGLFIATRNGVWYQSRPGLLTPLASTASFLDREAQALCRVPGGLWVGTRTGLFFCPDRSLP